MSLLQKSLRTPPQTVKGMDGVEVAYGIWGDSANLTWDGDVNTLRFYVSWVYACIDRIAKAMSTLDWISYLDGEDEGQLQRTELEYSHWLPTLLRHPNSEIVPANIYMLAVRWFLLNGNAYLYTPLDRAGFPLEMWPLPSNRVQLVMSSSAKNPIAGYIYHHPTKGKIPFRPEEIVHVPNSEPSQVSPFVGASPMLAALDAAEVDVQTMQFLSRYMRNDALPAFALLHPEDMDDDQFNRFESRFNETFKGSKNAGKWVFLQDGMQIQPIASNGRQKELQEMDVANRDRICIVFGVPEPYLTGKHQNRATAETVREEFYRNGVNPIARLFAQSFTRHARRFDVALSVDFKRYQYHDPAEERAERESLISKNIKTANEYREEMGLEPLPPAEASNELRTTVGGAQAIQSLVLAYSAGQIEREAAIQLAVIVYGIDPGEAPKLFIKRAEPAPTPDPVQVPPLPPSDHGDEQMDEQDDEEIDPEDDKKNEEIQQRRTIKTFSFVKEDASPTEKELYAYWKQYDAVIEAGTTRIQKGVVKGFKQLQAEVLAVIEDNTKAHKADDEKPKKPLRSNLKLFDLKKWEKIFADLTLDPIQRTIVQAATEAMADVGYAYETYETPFGDKVKTATASSTTRIKTAVGTAKVELEKLLRDNLDADVKEITEKIKAKFDFYQEAGAKRIAQTTSTYATNTAQYEAWDTLVEEVTEIEGIERLWLSQRDGKVRDAHRAADGQAANEEGLFSVGGEMIRHPGEGTARNAINCRCVQRPRIQR